MKSKTASGLSLSALPAAPKSELLDEFSRLVHLEERVRSSENDGLRLRWTFGQELLSKRDGKGRLPNRYLSEVVDRTGASRAELTYRMQFAQRFSTESELLNAIEQFGSWYRIVKDALPAHANTDTTNDGLPDSPEGVYRTIVADPPWRYSNTATRGAVGGSKHYSTMAVEDICALAEQGYVPAADDAHLYLWATNAFLRPAFDVMDAWGFTYKTCLTWCKTQIGLGNYFRNATEHVLFGVRGSLHTQVKDVSTWFESPRGKHSAKPEMFLDMVETASPGPYLEMFARRRRLGWEVWGHES